MVRCWRLPVVGAAQAGARAARSVLQGLLNKYTDRILPVCFAGRCAMLFLHGVYDGWKSRHSGGWARHAPRRRDGSPAKADGRNRRPTNSMAYLEDIFSVWAQRIRRLLG